MMTTLAGKAIIHDWERPHLQNDAIHDVLFTLHKTRPISDAALSNDFERRCARIAIASRWALGLCFVSILVLAVWPLLPWSTSMYRSEVTDGLLILMLVIGGMCIAFEALPLIRDLRQFDVYTYQVRQLVAEHDFASAATLDHFPLPVLIMTEKWLGLRVERSRLRLGILLGGSDKVAILAVVTGAWTLWRNLPANASLAEQYAYWLLGVFIGASGLGGMLANASVARMAYHRDLLAMAICKKSQPLHT